MTQRLVPPTTVASDHNLAATESATLKDATMVEIEAVEDAAAEQSPVASASDERILDAEAIEAAAATIDRPSARAHLEALAKKLRRDGAALKRVEDSRAKMEGVTVEGGGDESAPSVAAAETAAAAPAASAEAAPLAASIPPPEPPRPIPISTAKMTPGVHYNTIDKFAFDAGKYDSPTVSIYVALPNVGTIPRDNITCDFTSESFDLIVRDLNGKSYRLVKDDLEKDIDPEKSKIIVKADKIVIKLGKVKSDGSSSYDYWSELTAKKKKKSKATKENPAAGLMDMMKDMYDSGDDNMKRMIGETMLKQREGRLGDGMDDPMGMGMGGMGDMGMGGMGL